QNFEFVQTCGVCEQICNEANIKDHDCLHGYSSYIVDPKTLYFYPLAGNIIQIPQSTDSTERQKISEPLKKVSRKYSKIDENTRIKLNFDDEELLILEVQKRPSLWDYSLLLVQRKTNIKRQLWAEVSSTLNGKISAEEVQKRFKSLHDTYRKIIQSEERMSGSARSDTTQKWPHYHSMAFLRDSCLQKITVSNLNTDDSTSNFSSLIDDDIDLESQTERKKGRKKRIKNDASRTALEKIANAICNQNKVTLPPPPESDEIDYFLTLLGCRLQKILPKTRLEIMQKVLQLTYEILMNEDNNK
ncbi:hypothetical protein ALC62_02471, partial [Cyphomyrmex costatus]